jgi:hypothetical protein
MATNCRIEKTMAIINEFADVKEKRKVESDFNERHILKTIRTKIGNYTKSADVTAKCFGAAGIQ